MKVFNTAISKGKRKALRKSQTDAEKKLWLRLRSKYFFGYKFYRQYGIGPCIADFYCPKLKLVVEADGGQHFENKTVQYDQKRSEFFAKLDIAVARFSNNDILKNIDAVLIKLSQQLPPTPSLDERGGEGVNAK